jgi:hypothetical protein
MREVQIDHPVYLVDDETHTYRFLRRSPSYRALARGLNERSKRSVDGYSRRLRSGRAKPFRYKSLNRERR